MKELRNASVAVWRRRYRVHSFSSSQGVRRSAARGRAASTAAGVKAERSTRDSADAVWLWDWRLSNLSLASASKRRITFLFVMSAKTEFTFWTIS